MRPDGLVERRIASSCDFTPTELTFLVTHALSLPLQEAATLLSGIQKLPAQLRGTAKGHLVKIGVGRKKETCS